MIYLEYADSNNNNRFTGGFDHVIMAHFSTDAYCTTIGTFNKTARGRQEAWHSFVQK